MDFGGFDTFIFDMDGTIWRWQKLYKGAREALGNIASKGKQIVFVTNNTLLTRPGFVKKLNGFGIDAGLENVINAGYVMAVYLKKIGKDIRVLAFGKGLVGELRRNGVKLSNGTNVDFLAVGLDTEFDMKKLSKAFDALNAGARFLGTTKGKLLVTEKKMMPGTGIIVGMIESMSGKRAEIIGKPSDFMCGMIKRIVESKMERTVFVGDDESDVVTGKKIGCRTCLVRTGVNEGKGNTKPDFVIDSIADIRV